jgi:hypothetical protein
MMTVEITIEVPDSLAFEVERYRERLPEVLERGLREVALERPADFVDENAILSLLASQPQPEQVLALRPSSEFQARVTELLARNKEGELSRHEERELERALTLEHLVRLAKAHASHRLTKGI